MALARSFGAHLHDTDDVFFAPQSVASRAGAARAVASGSCAQSRALGQVVQLWARADARALMVQGYGGVHPDPWSVVLRSGI